MTAADYSWDPATRDPAACVAAPESRALCEALRDQLPEIACPCRPRSPA